MSRLYMSFRPLLLLLYVCVCRYKAKPAPTMKATAKVQDIENSLKPNEDHVEFNNDMELKPLNAENASA